MACTTWTAASGFSTVICPPRTAAHESVGQKSEAGALEMAMSEETILASGQDDAYQKFKCSPGSGGYGLSAGYHGKGNNLGRYKVEGKSTACKHFSIRGFVARTRDINKETCWPFSPHLLETRLKDGCDPLLPPLEIPEHRWWNCQNCTSSLNTSAEASIEKGDVNNLLESSQEHSGELISCKNAEQMATNRITGQTRIESIVPVGLPMHNLENLDSELKKSEALINSSKFANSKGNITIRENFCHVQEQEIACAETEQPTLQKPATELQKNTDGKLDSIENKAEMVSESQKDTTDKIVSVQDKIEILSDLSQPSNSSKCFSRNEDIIEEMRGIISGNEMQATTSQRLPMDSTTSAADDSDLDVNQKENVDHVHISYEENTCLDEYIFAENQKDRETVPGTMLESVIVERAELSVDNGDHIHVAFEEKKGVTSVKNSEPKPKRRSQKKRSIADIIASEPFLPESLYKETEQSIHADIMEETIQGVENCAQVHVQTNNVKHQKETPNCKHNITSDKRRPPKLEVRKKRRGLEAQFSNSSLLHFAKDSLDSFKSDTIRDSNQVTQDTLEVWRTSKDKSLEKGSFHLENGQSKPKGMELDEEIPMDIVELMARNQHDRGLSKPVNIYESHNIQTDKNLMKMKATVKDFSHVTELLDKEKISQKQNSGIENRVAELGQSNQANQRTYLTSPSGIKALGDTSKIYMFQTNSVNSSTKGIESLSSQSRCSMLQLPQLFNPWQSCSSGFATSGFGGINAARNPTIPVVHSSRSHAVLTDCDRNGHFYMNGRALPAVRCQEATAAGRYKEMKNLCGEVGPASSDLRNPELSKSENKGKSAINQHWVSSSLNSQERLTQTESLSKLMSSRNSDLQIMGSVFDFLNQNQKENDVSKQPSRTDPAFYPAFLEGKNELGVMQQGNAQTPTFGNEHVSSASVLRLMGQCLSVANRFENGEIRTTGNQYDRNGYKVFPGSSEKHINWVHAIPHVPLEEVERNENERLSKAGIVFRDSTPAQGSMHINNVTMNPNETVLPAPKFGASEHLVLNGRRQVQEISCAFPVKTNYAVKSSTHKTKSPPPNASLFGIKQDGVQYSNVTSAYRNESENPSTLPLNAQITDSFKGLNSSPKGLRSCRRLARAVHSRRHHRSALDIYLERRCQRLQAGTTDPNQTSSEEAGNTERDPGLILNRGNPVPSSYSEKRACNTQICTLNQNPAELNSDDGEEDRDILGCEDCSHDVGSAEKVLRKKCSPSRAQKHRKTLKIRQLRGFFSHNADSIGDSINRNDSMKTVWNGGCTIQQVCGNSVSGRWALQK